MNNENLLNEIARSRQLIEFKYHLNEQPNVGFRIFKGKRIVLKRGEGQKTLGVDSKIYKAETPESEWNSVLSQDSKMTSLMDYKSKQLWNKLKKDATNKSYAVASLETFNETYPEEKWDGVNVSVKRETNREPVIESKKEYPLIPMKVPAQLSPSSDFFIDNYYKTTDLFKQSVQNDLIKPISEQMALLNPPEGKPKAYLESISVFTSCSRVPNTQSPDGKTYDFATLSQLRNKEAREYIISELQKIGVLVDEGTKVTSNWEGSNKDGTSGPEWTKNNKDKPKYEQYKYLDADIEVVFNTQLKPIEDTEQKFVKVESDLYDIIFIKKGTPDIYIRLPKISTFLNMFRRKSKKVARPVECPRF